jgi:alpha-amylase
VGNLDEVIEALTRRCYRPFLEAMKGYPSIHFTFHASGPLLRWWEEKDPAMIDLVGGLADSGQVEILAGGFFEPVLVALSPEDRRGQISRMREYLEHRFGQEPVGLWLAERVWDQEIIEDLIAEGIKYVLVDDRHFEVSGFSPEDLHGYYLTESAGDPLAVFPIDERLRYLIPFQPVEEVTSYLRGIHSGGGTMVIYGDDGEKLGGWPGTARWVYSEGWLRRFLDGLLALADEYLEIVTCSQVLEAERPLGLCYLPTSSYTEMEGWALPAAKLVEKEALDRSLGQEFDRFKPFIRGGHWRNFLVKYPESNLLHKKVLYLSGMLHHRKLVPKGVLEDLYASQCNDAYWHGIFGGLYLPHLRGAVWRHISRVERYLRVGEDLDFEVLDIDLDGRDEIWAHSSAFSATIRSAVGGSLLEYTSFPLENNYCNVLGRRFEAYHPSLTRESSGAVEEDGAVERSSIHDLSKGISPEVKKGIQYDASRRGIFVDRFFDAGEVVEKYQGEGLSELGCFARGEYRACLIDDGVVLERMEGIHVGRQNVDLGVRKELTFSQDGEMVLKATVMYRALPSEARYGIEMSLFPPFLYRGNGKTQVDGLQADLGIAARSFAKAGCLEFNEGDQKQSLRVEWTPPASLWCYPIFTLSQSESGFDRTLQGFSIMPNWSLQPGGEGEFSVTLTWRFVSAREPDTPEE